MKKEKKTKPSPWKPGMTIQEMYEARPKMWIMVTEVLVIRAFLIAWSITALKEQMERKWMVGPWPNL